MVESTEARYGHQNPISAQEEAPMATVQLQLNNLLSRVTETQIRQVLSPLGKVSSLRLSGTSCLVDIESATVVQAIDSSGIGERKLSDIVKIDSSGIGELNGVTVSVVGTR
jgi:hypothetical protein